MPFGGQICPEPAFFELESHWGRRCAISMGRARAFRRPTMLVRPRRSRFSRYVVTAWEFLLCFPRGLVVHEGNRPGLVASWAKKRCHYGRKQFKTKLVETTSEASGVCLLRPAPALLRALGRKPPPRERNARHQRETPPTTKNWRMFNYPLPHYHPP